MIGAFSIQMVECSYCSGSLGLSAYCAKSEQDHNCAGMESLIYPGLNLLVQSTAGSFVLYPAGSRSQEESFCLFIDGKGKSVGPCKATGSLKGQWLSNQ